MTEPAHRTRWKALEVGPGGVPADQVHVRGPGSAPPRSTNSNPGPSAVFGSFDEERPRRRAALGWLALAVVIAVIAAVALWSSNSATAGSSTDLNAGDCLRPATGGAVAVVDCSSPDAEFTVAARFDDTTDEEVCTPVASDLVLATRDPAMLCLNYLASVGDCLYAGAATDVGKAPCRTPGTSSTPTGLFRVIAVLVDTVDTQDCPTGTLQSLVHLADREVVCLGMP